MANQEPKQSIDTEEAKSFAIEVAITTVLNVVKDLYKNSKAKQLGYSFDEYCERELMISKLNPSSRFSAPPQPAEWIADAVSTAARPLTFATYDTLSNANRAVDNAANQIAKGILGTLGIR